MIKSPSQPNYNTWVSSSMIPRQPNVKIVSPRHRTSMIDYKSKIPQEKDKASDIKGKIQLAKHRKVK